MPNKKDIVEFYNGFARYQQKAAFNERHEFLYSFLKELGLCRSSRVLELGCGVGVITSLMARTVREGPITALDLSPDAIELARHNSVGKNVSFQSGDILEFDPKGATYDFITLFDVLEHIPLENQSSLFKALTGWMSDDTLLVVNIPNPEQTRYLRERRPEKLQVIDLELTADALTRSAYENGLVLDFFMTYDIWQKKDYQVMTFRKRAAYREIEVKRGNRVIRMLRRTAYLLLG